MALAHQAFWLVVAHFVIDYPLQGDTTAIRKSRHCKLPDIGVPWYYWMTAHALMHAGGVMLILGNLQLAIAEFIAHFVIDSLKCEKIFNIHVDQILHLGCKIMWVMLLLPDAHGR